MVAQKEVGVVPAGTDLCWNRVFPALVQGEMSFQSVGFNSSTATTQTGNKPLATAYFGEQAWVFHFFLEHAGFQGLEKGLQQE